jgi:hypothetical protein
MSIDVTSSTTAGEAGASAPPDEDLFALGRRAADARDAVFGRRATFIRTRQLLPTRAWRGPRDAAESYVEEADLAALGGWASARAAGVGLLVGGSDAALHRAAAADGARSLWRVPFRVGEGDAARIERLRAALALEGAVWGLLPTPDGEPYGLDTVRMFALCRLVAPPAWHLAADVAALGPRLAQMCLAFGADELRAPIVAERALRLGDNAHNPALTRKEAATLIRGAGLRAAERSSGGAIEEVT